MEISEVVFQWLKDIQVVSTATPQNGRYQLDQNTTEAFDSGENIAIILKMLHELANIEEPISQELNDIRNVNSPAEKLQNWNILSNVLDDQLDIQIDMDTKALIVAGDTDMVSDLLEQLYKANKDMEQIAIRRTKLDEQGNLMLDQVDLELPIDQTYVPMEFILNSICKNFGLKIKQGNILIVNNGKNMVKIMRKGLKGSFAEIIQWYTDIYAHARHLVILLSRDDGKTPLDAPFGVISSGMKAGDIEVVTWAFRVLIHLSEALPEFEMDQMGWNWFSTSSTGIEQWLIALHTHGQSIQEYAVQLISNFAKNNFLELFTVQLRKIYLTNEKYLQQMHEFLPYIPPSGITEINTSGVIDYWIDIAVGEVNATADTFGGHVAAYGLLSKIWQIFPDKIGQDENLSGQILYVLKKGVRDSNRSLRFSAATALFHLLEIFTEERNPIAPIIYKTLTFAIIETHNDEIFREYALTNFVRSFNSTPSIPVSVLTDPLIKLIQVSQGHSYFFTIADFDFLISVARHPRLGVRTAVHLLDVLGRTYIHDTVYSKAAKIPFMLVATRFIASESVQEYIARYSKLTVRLLYDDERTALTQRRLQSKLHSTSIKEPNDAEIFAKREMQNRSRIICELFANIIKLWNPEINHKFKIILSRGCKEIKKLTRSDHRGLIDCLALLGDPTQLIEEHGAPQKAESTPSTLSKAESTPNLIPLQTGTTYNSNTPSLPMTSKNVISYKTTSKIKQNLQRISTLRAEKQLMTQMAAEQKSEIEFRTKISLKRQIQRRHLELGVTSTRSVPPIFDELDVKQVQDDILRDLTLEPVEDQETVNMVIKRYTRALKYIFNNYVGTGYKQNLPIKQTFDGAERILHLTESELFKALRDFEIAPKLISRDEMSKILHAYNRKRQYADPSSVTYPHFVQVFVQLALFIYSKPEMDLTYLPPGIAVKMLIQNLREQWHKEDKNLDIFDVPDPGTGDKAIVKRLNSELLQNPDLDLPLGYKKLMSKDIQIQYKIPKTLGLSKSMRTSLEILDDLICSKFQFHILEPQILINNIPHAKGIILRPKPKANTHRKKAQSTVPDYHNEEYNLQGQISQSGISELLRFEVMKFPTSEKLQALECAKVLDNLLHGVMIGSSVAYDRRSVSERPKVNKFVLQKEQQGEIQEKQRARQEQKRRDHRQELHDTISKAKEEKEKKDEEDRIAKEERKAKWAKVREKKQAERKQEKREKKRQVKEFQKQRDEIKRAKQKKTPREVDPEKFAAALQERQTKHKKELKKLQIKREVEEKAKNERGQVENEQRKRAKQALNEKINFENKVRQADKQKEEASNRVVNRFDIRQILEAKSKLIETIFNYYIHTYMPKNDPTTPTELNFVGYNKFTQNFNIWPGLCSKEECHGIFNKLIRSKTSYSNSIDLAELKSILVRLAILGQRNLKMFMGQNLGEDYEDEVEISPKVLEGIFNWMDISDNPKLAMEKLKGFNLQTKSISMRDRKKQVATIQKKKRSGLETEEVSEEEESDSEGSQESESYEN